MKDFILHFLCLSFNSGVLLVLWSWIPVWFCKQRIVSPKTFDAECSRSAWSSWDILCCFYFQSMPIFPDFSYWVLSYCPVLEVSKRLTVKFLDKTANYFQGFGQLSGGQKLLCSLITFDALWQAFLFLLLNRNWKRFSFKKLLLYTLKISKSYLLYFLYFYLTI